MSNNKKILEDVFTDAATLTGEQKMDLEIKMSGAKIEACENISDAKAYVLVGLFDGPRQGDAATGFCTMAACGTTMEIINLIERLDEASLKLKKNIMANVDIDAAFEGLIDDMRKEDKKDV